MLNRTSAQEQSSLFVNLTDLTPFTHYKITVDCIPLLEDEIVVGFWSDEVSVEFITKEDGLSRYNQYDQCFNCRKVTGEGSSVHTPSVRMLLPDYSEINVNLQHILQSSVILDTNMYET